MKLWPSARRESREGFEPSAILSLTSAISAARYDEIWQTSQEPKPRRHERFIGAVKRSWRLGPSHITTASRASILSYFCDQNEGVHGPFAARLGIVVFTTSVTKVARFFRGLVQSRAQVVSPRTTNQATARQPRVGASPRTHARVRGLLQ